MNFDELVKLQKAARRRDLGTDDALVLAALRPEKAGRVKRLLELEATPRVLAAGHPFLEPPDPLEPGDVELGHVWDIDQLGQPLGLKLENLLLHLIVVGPTGCGKTSLLLNLCHQTWVRHRIPFWFLDHERQGTRLFDLMPDILYVSPRELRLNMLEPPPGVAPEKWLGYLSPVLREMWIGDGGLNLVRDLILQLYEKHGVLAGGQNYPCLRELLAAMQQMRVKLNSRTGGYWESVMNRLSGLRDSLGSMLMVTRGHDIAALMQRPVVFRIPEAPEFSNFLANLLLTWLAAYLEDKQDSGLRLLFVVDEASRCWNPRKAERNDLQDTVANQALRTMRRRGVSICLGDQVPAELPITVMANISTKIAMKLEDGRNIRAVSESMNLTIAERQFLPQLELRFAVVKYPGWPKAFLARVAELGPEFNCKVSEAQLEETIRPLVSGLEFVPCEGGQATIARGQGEGRAKNPAEATREHRGGNRAATERGLTLQEAKYLSAVNQKPFVKATRRAEQLDWSLSEESTVRTTLAQKGLIVEHKVTTGRRGAPMRFAELAEQGAEELRKLGVKVVPLRGRGSWRSKFVAWLAAEHYRVQGAAIADIERTMDGKAIDVYVEMADGRRIGVEVALSATHQVINLAKDSDIVDEVVFVVEDEKVEEKIREQCEGLFGVGGMNWKFLIIQELVKISKL